MHFPACRSQHASDRPQRTSARRVVSRSASNQSLFEGLVPCRTPNNSSKDRITNGCRRISVTNQQGLRVQAVHASVRARSHTKHACNEHKPTTNSLSASCELQQCARPARQAGRPACMQRTHSTVTQRASRHFCKSFPQPNTTPNTWHANKLCAAQHCGNRKGPGMVAGKCETQQTRDLSRVHAFVCLAGLYA